MQYFQSIYEVLQTKWLPQFSEFMHYDYGGKCIWWHSEDVLSLVPLILINGIETAYMGYYFVLYCIEQSQMISCIYLLLLALCLCLCFSLPARKLIMSLSPILIPLPLPHSLPLPGKSLLFWWGCPHFQVIPLSKMIDNGARISRGWYHLLANHGGWNDGWNEYNNMNSTPLK